MKTLGLILFAVLVGIVSSAHHVHVHSQDTPDFGNTLPIDIQNYLLGQPSDTQDYGLGLTPDSYVNNYPSYSGADLWRLLSQSGSGYPADDMNYLSPGSPSNYVYPVQRPVSSSFKERFVRNYDSGATEYGVRNQQSVRTNNPGYDPTYSRICAYFPVGTCVRSVNRYPRQPVIYNNAAF